MVRCWLHDLDGWAAVIARLLKPGGILSVFDDHPVNWLFEQDTETLVATGYDYFTHSESSQGWPATYIGDLDVPVAQQARKYERLWPLSAIFGALRRAGLVVEHFGEHRERVLGRLPEAQAGAEGDHPDDLLYDRAKAGVGSRHGCYAVRENVPYREDTKTQSTLRSSCLRALW